MPVTKKIERESPERRKSVKRTTIRILRLAAAVCFCAALVLALSGCVLIPSATEEIGPLISGGVVLPDYVESALIRVDGASRRGVKLEGVNAIVIHYVANSGSTARQNRNYFDNPESETSSHFIVGLEGEVLLCVPLDEKSSASNERNADTISIELCHPDETGEFTEATCRRAADLCARLCEAFGLDPETALIRHYDVTGKLCPKYFVEHVDAWEAFKAEVRLEMDPGKETGDVG